MKTNKLSPLSRIILIIAGLSLLAVLYTPIWRIDLNAPQYPEGLRLKICANDIKGDVNIINGLNHYIGMKTLHKQDFPEFSILPGCIVFFAAAFILTALFDRKRWLNISFGLFVTFGVVAIADFWRWEYNYGHNLDPHAAIVVPGMAYQPPLLGFKQLLNFGAYSIPDTGGWIFIGCGILLLMAFVVEWKKNFAGRGGQMAHVMAASFLLFGLVSCKTQPEAIHIGADNCAFCRMTISDLRYGAEIVTATGKVYKFDDIHCMEAFARDLDAGTKKRSTVYFVDFCNGHQLVEAGKCALLKSEEIQCPMGGHVAAFATRDSLDNVRKIYGGELFRWSL